MKIGFVFGTRPEIIKLSPIIRLCDSEEIDYFSIYTGQHYSHNMSKMFFEELRLPEPKYILNIKSKAPHRQGDHTGRMMIELEEILLEERPSVVLVQGDTNTVLAGSLTVSKISTTKSFTGLDIKLGHVEAGLRSGDRSMPEEINRIISDHLSNFLFVPTVNAKNIAVSEGIDESKVFVTGNTIVDALQDEISSKGLETDVLIKHGLRKDSYMLLTLHRQENVDSRERLVKILAGVERICKKHKLPVIFPIHPRTDKILEKFNIKLHEGIQRIEPCGFSKFRQLEKNARLILTDSGGVQEEACWCLVPCVTLRTSTERPETVDVGANTVAGIEPDLILKETGEMLKKERKWENPFGNGTAAEKILSVLQKEV